MSVEETAKKDLSQLAIDIQLAVLPEEVTLHLPEKGGTFERTAPLADLKAICEEWALMRELLSDANQIRKLEENGGVAWSIRQESGGLMLYRGKGRAQPFDSPLSAYKALKHGG